MKRGNGARKHDHHAHVGMEAQPSAACPTCGAVLTQEKYESILRIDGARRKEVADERAMLEREREAIVNERANIATAAVEVERSKWDAEISRVQREGDRQRKQAEADLERLARAHGKELQAELRKRDAQERHLAREVAAAKADSDARVRLATRTVKEHQRTMLDELRGQLRTVEQRRRRDEDALKRTIADLQRKAEDRDRAHFGPEGEEDLAKTLREQFCGDRVERRGRGGDVLHTVIDAGRDVATIVFEVKNTGGWQRDYLRQTQRAMELHRTRYGVVVTRTLPGKSIGMCVLSGVIIVVPTIAAQVVAVLRDGIVSISKLRLSENGRSAKAAALFDYLCGDEFHSAIQRVTEKIVELRESLSREKSHHDGWWSARENHYATILRAAAGIDARVGDLLGRRTDDPTRTRALTLRSGASLTTPQPAAEGGR
jgi:hypothetical protein